MSLVARFIARATANGCVVHDSPRGVTIQGEPSQAARGVATTGSIVVLTSQEPRSRSLLPFVHYAFLSRRDIVDTLDDLFAQLGTDLPSCVSIISGPSKSGDIEMTLSVGVHGPGEVHVILTD